MSEAVDPDAVAHVAELARIDLRPAEQEALAEEFAEILEYFETLEEVPETDGEPELVNVMRPDEVAESLSQDAATGNAPETEDGYFKGPPVG
ncbi:MAG: Asp-tRNA(Asn)/Glu-tRNA(Gln) amidotransferase subunit GatC [Halanaeroarchaeum sp.]